MAVGQSRYSRSFGRAAERITDQGQRVLRPRCQIERLNLIGQLGVHDLIKAGADERHCGP